MGQVRDLVSPPWATASVLALHLASRLRDHLSMCTPHELLRTPRMPELFLAVWTMAGGSDMPAHGCGTSMVLSGFLTDDAPPPPSASSTARTTKEVLDKLVDGDSLPIDLLSQFEAAVLPATPRGNDAKLRQMTDRHRQICETVQATEDALQSALRDLAHQKKIHEDAAGRLQARIDDLQALVTRLVKTLDRKRGTDIDPGAVDTRIRPKALLSLSRKPPPPKGTQAPNVLQEALDKLRPANNHRIDKHHAAWYPSLLVLLTAWVARGSLSFQDLQLFSVQFESTLEMPPPAPAPVAKPLPESPIVDLTGPEDPERQTPQSGVTDFPVLPEGTHGPRDARSASEVSPPVSNGFFTGLNAVDDQQLGTLAQAFHLTMQLAGCKMPSFTHDILRHQWERLRASLPLAPAVAQAIAEFVKCHP